MAGLAFNDVTGGQGLIQDCEDNLNFLPTQISGNSALLKQFTRHINVWYHKTITMILASQDSWDFDDSNNTDYPIGTIPLTTARDITFPLSSNILKIKRIDITYDGTNWNRAVLNDSGVSSLGYGNDALLDSNFSINNPRYDLVGANGIFVYPAATTAQVSAGAAIRIEFYRDIVEFTIADTTKTPGFDTPWHKMISLGACITYAKSKNLPSLADFENEYADYEQRLKQYYGQKDTDNEFIVKPLFQNFN